MAQHADLNVRVHVEVTVIRPGDTALVRMPRGTPQVQLETIADRLRERLPGVEVLLLSGVDGIDVYRPDDPAEPPARADGLTHYRAYDGDCKAVPMCDAPQEGAQLSGDWSLINCSDCRAH